MFNYFQSFRYLGSFDVLEIGSSTSFYFGKVSWLFELTAERQAITLFLAFE